MKSLFAIVAFAATLACARVGASRIYCAEEDGELVLHGAPPGVINCMMLVTDGRRPSVKGKLSEGQCSISWLNSVVTYKEMLVDQVQKCKYECRPSQYKCIPFPPVDAKTCACRPGGPRAVLVPITEDDIIRMNGPPEDSCEQRAEGEVFGPEMNCATFVRDADAEKIAPIADGKCMVIPNPDADKQRKIVAKMPGGAQACRYACRKAGYRCDDGGRPSPKCECSRPLTPQLVVIDMNKISRAVVDENGVKQFDENAFCQQASSNTTDTCGPCGYCDSKTGSCLPKPNMAIRDLCPCGKICPLVEEVLSRSSHHSSPIECVSNDALMNYACGTNGALGDGTSVPNLCTEASIDALDSCTCAPGYSETMDNGPAGSIGNTCSKSE